MILENNTSFANDHLSAILQECIAGYTELYEAAHSQVKFIIFDTLEAVKKCREEMAAELDDDDYDGSFIPPQEQTNVLTILALVKDKNIRGAEQYFKEKSVGSLRDEIISNRETRGVKLMAFFEFVELILHEYSHLCSYEKLMMTTDWADPHIVGNDWNYHLHDELIARYRGTRAMLHMAVPYAEKNLLYSLWMGYWNDLSCNFKSNTESIKEFLKVQSNEIEEDMLQFMKQNGMSGADMVRELETELAHKLYFDGVLSNRGVPKLSSMEVIEFLTLEETQRRTIPLIYAIKNPYATYQGAQLLGLIQAFHDHFSETIHTDGLELKKKDLILTNTLKKPFYEYVNVEKTKLALNSFIRTFTDWT